MSTIIDPTIDCIIFLIFITTYYCVFTYGIGFCTFYDLLECFNGYLKDCQIFNSLYFRLNYS